MKEEQGAMITYLQKQRDEAMHQAVSSNPPAEGAMISHLKREQEKVESQIAGLVAGSPVKKPQKTPRDMASMDELYNIVSGGVAAQKPGKVYVQNARIGDASGEVVGNYGAYRGDAMSPATQNGNGAIITNNPNDIYIGGRVPMGSKINAAYTGEDDTFYLKQKFTPVKPYPLTYPSGRTMEVTTSNMNKAAWLYAALMDEPQPIDWFGYYKLPNAPQREGFVHALARGATNFFPALGTSVAGFAAQTINDLFALGGEGTSKIFKELGLNELIPWSEHLTKYFEGASKLARKTTNELMEDVTWQYGPEGVGDTYGNKAGYIIGQALPMVASTFAAAPTSITFMSVAEAADSARQVRNAFMDKGNSTLASLGAATATGAGVFALGMLPEWFGSLYLSARVPAKNIVRMSREAPEELNRIFKARNRIMALSEAFLSEPEQDILTSVVAGEETDWEAALYTAITALIVSNATLAITNPNPAQAIQDNVKKFQDFLNTHQQFVDFIVQGSNGAIQKDNIDQIFTMLGDPEHAGDLWNYLKEGIIANFDKISDEQKKVLLSKIKSSDPAGKLETEMSKLDKRVDTMLNKAAVVARKNGLPELTEDQRALVKLMLRGIAARQLANFNVLPSKMAIPDGVFGGFTDLALAQNAEGMTEGGNITVNNALPESGLPVGVVQPSSAKGNTNLETSAAVKNEYAAAGVSSPQSVGFAGLSHEFWHWVEQATGLPNVGEFMGAIQELAEQMVPGITAGKSGAELSEAYAYAVGFAGEKVKKVLGLTGPAADYVDFMNLAYNATEIAQGVGEALSGYMESYRNVLKNNKKLVDSVIDSYGTGQLRGAIDNFVETGNPGALKFDDMRALNAALASATDYETADKLGQIFESQPKAESFMERYAREYDQLLAKDREGAASKLAEYRKIANEKLGISEEVTPGNSNQDTVADKAAQVTAQEAPVETEQVSEQVEEKPLDDAKTEIEPRVHTEGLPGEKTRAGTPYDTDALVRGDYDNSPEDVVKYIENAAKWAHNIGITKEDLKGRTVKLSTIANKLQIKLEPTFGDTKIDHRAAYVILAKAKLKQLNEKGLLTDAQKKRAKNTQMFAARSKLKAGGYDTKVMDFLATRIADNVASDEEKVLYTEIARFNKKLSDIYVDFGPYTPVENARAAKTAAEQFAIALQDLSASKDDVVQRVINGGLEPELVRGMLPKQVDAFENFGVYNTYRPVLDKEGNVVIQKQPKAVSLIDSIADYILDLDDFINDQQFEEERIKIKENKVSSNEARFIKILEGAGEKVSKQLLFPKLAGKKRVLTPEEKQASAYLGKVGTSKTDPMDKYFTPAYEEGDASDKFIDSSVIITAQRLLNSDRTSAKTKKGAAAVLKARGAMSPYANPILGFLKRDVIHTPTPLEEMGVSMEEAEEIIRAGGLEPYNFADAAEKITPDYIRRNLRDNDSVGLTRRNMIAKLLADVPSIGASKNKAERMRVLHAISAAKAMADQIFESYIDSEDNYNNNPTGKDERNTLIKTEENFKQKDPRYSRQLVEHMERGYTEATDVTNLDVSDEIAFPYGNNMFRGVIGYKLRMPSGAEGFIIYEDVNIPEWEERLAKGSTATPGYLRISAKDLGAIGFLRKPLQNYNPARYIELMTLYDKISDAHENWQNWVRIAQNSVAEVEEDTQAYKDERKGLLPETYEVESDEAADVDETSPENDYYAARSDIPEVDPGAYAMAEGQALTEEEFEGYFNETEEEFLRRLEEGIVTPGEKLAMWQRLQNKEEQLKPKFEPYAAGLLKTIKTLRDGIAERKFGGKFWGKILMMGAWQTGLDRKLRAIFGDGVSKAFNFVLASSRAQEISEGARHAFDKAITDNVFKGSRKNYEQWVVKNAVKEYDANLSNDQNVKITKGEILGMAYAKYIVDNKLIDVNQYTNPEERMRAFYKNYDELIGTLTDEDWEFIKTAAETLASVRGQSSFLPQYWVPSVLANDYGRKGWGTRLKNTPDNSVNVISSQQPLAATSLYESVLSTIGTRALKESGLTNQLKMLHDLLVFEDIDLSQFKQIEDVEVYDELLKEATALKFDVEKAIGPTMMKWLIDNIDVDLKFNPLVKDLAKNPVLNGFQKATRSVASSLLIGNLKQGYVNLGNYDLFLGLSNSGMTKFYTADRINAWMHFAEAWKLAMEIPEFKRRLEQSGLSEQMRRVADMNEDSFVKDVQEALYKSGKDKGGDIVGAINTLSKISTKYGLATNVVPDLVGIALGTYAVWNDVMMRNHNDVKATQDEIVTHVLNRVSSSNYMTRSAATKMLNKAGLEAVVMFKNDQLQKIGMMSEAVLTLLNSTDPAVRKKAWKDIQSGAYSTLRYILIQAGWIAAMVKMLTGHELDDEEWAYLYEATIRETLSQIGDTTAAGSFIVPILTGIYEGRDMGTTLLPIGGIQRISTAARKGNIIKALGDFGAFTGLTPVAPAAVRIGDAFYKLLSEDPREQKVGLLMLGGRQEPTAQKMMAYTRSEKSGKLRDKKSRKDKN